MFWGRLLVLGLLALWVALTLPFERSGAYLLAIGAFALLGAPPYLLARRGRGGSALTAVFLLLDAGILVFILLVPPPFYVEGWTPQINLRLPNILYLGIFLVSMALTYSPALVVWTGVAATAAWSAGYLWIASLPGSVPSTSRDSLDQGMSSAEVISRFLDPQAVSLTHLFNQVVFLVLVTLIMALSVWRSRRLVRRQVEAEAQRGALSRNFSPNIVRELSGRALDPARQPAAVLFADMVGFTSISERLAPESLVGLLREFHGRLARIAFGDAIMLHFGTPRPQADDPVRALACAVEMVDEIERWNAEREKAGEAPISIGIGAHYGEVLAGNIGGEHRLEYTVLGDMVNVASRLERLTRETGSPLVVRTTSFRPSGTAGRNHRRSPQICALTELARCAVAASPSRSGVYERTTEAAITGTAAHSEREHDLARLAPSSCQLSYAVEQRQLDQIRSPRARCQCPKIAESWCPLGKAVDGRWIGDEDPAA
jgi:adenylate cyclase